MSVLLRSVLAVLCGVALALAFEPVAAWFLLPFAVAGFVLATRGLTARRGWIPGLAFGVGFYFVLTYWMRSVGTDAWLGMASFEALFYAVLGSVSAALHRRRLWPLWIAAAWVTMESWRADWPFSGMPWGRLSFAVVDSPFQTALPYVGSTGVSLGLALLGALLAWLVVSHGRDRLAPVCALVGFGVLTTMTNVWSYDPHTVRDVTVAAVQGDVPGNGDNILLDYRQVTQNQVDATIALADRVASGEQPRPDFVLWPENSTAVDPFSDAITNAGIRAASEAIGVPILVGAIVDAGPGHVLNQGIVWDPVTGAGERYTKRHPVVFGEYIPFRKFLDGLKIGRLTMVGRDMLSGTRKTPLTVGGVEVADSICFDVAYDDGIYEQVDRGAELLTVQTSNATFIHTDQIEQQFAMTRLRAVETGRWVVVASTNGLSGVIAPDGSVVATAEKRTQAVMDEQVGLSTGIPFGVRLGPWTGRACFALTCLGLLLGVVPYRRRQPLQEPGPREAAVAPDFPHETSTPIST
ncbi:MAG: apolipoprotein N-acyltransferase [Nocardioides sp.]|nr:apolipoprotein N-acyltransferase [Nocardioides sp.]